MVVRFQKENIRFKPLNVLEFTSSRKRMSIIVQMPDDSIMLLTKGADTVLEKLLDDRESPLKRKTWQQLELMAQKGLRTLLLARRTLTKKQYEDWCRVFE